jgi:hypothetical protein
VAGLGQRIGAYSKAFCGCSRPARAGVTCPKNIPVPARAGEDCGSGKNRASGSKSGEPFCPNWTSGVNWIGAKVFWMAALLRLKKGLRSWQNQAGQRHEVDGGGRRPRCSSGKPTGLGQPGGSDSGRKHAGANICAPWRPRPSTKTAVASRGRPRLRQRSFARAFAQTRHVVDQPTPPRTHQTSLQRWPLAAALSQALENRTDFCLAGQLSSTARPPRLSPSNV